MARNTQRTRADKMVAAAAIVAHGSYEGASRASGIPSSTLRTWNADDEFQQLCTEAETAFGAEMRVQLAEVVRLATAEAIDRLQNGDVVLDAKSGQQVRVPVKGRDAMVIAGIAFDKLAVAAGRPTQITANTHEVTFLADQLRAISEAYSERLVAVQGPDGQRGG